LLRSGPTAPAAGKALARGDATILPPSGAPISDAVAQASDLGLPVGFPPQRESAAACRALGAAPLVERLRSAGSLRVLIYLLGMQAVTHFAARR